MTAIGEIIKNGEFVVEWSIKGFSLLLDKENVGYKSPSFFFANETWYLEIYSNDEISHEKKRWISLFLLRAATGPPITMEFTLGVKIANGKIGPQWHETRVFNEMYDWDGPLLLSKNELLAKKSELLPSDTLTLVCRMKCEKFIDFQGWGNAMPTNCSYCNKALVAQEDLSSHLPECEHLPIRCWKCNSDVAMKDWYDHKCNITKTEADSGTSMTTNCSYCNKTLDAQEDIASHLHKCEDLPIKCWRCTSDVAVKDWCDHKCNIREAEGEECCSRSSMYSNHSKVIQDYKVLFLKQKECDVILRVKEEEFPAHKCILAARSAVFDSTFRNDLQEKQAGFVDIEDCDPSSFSSFLRFLYCGETEIISDENVCSLFTTADKYDVRDLRDICVKFMKENMSVDTLFDTITLALQYCESELFTAATDFFIKNAQLITKTVQWQKFLIDKPMQGNELIIKLIDASAGKNE